MLGIAGAYVLRAVAEAGVMPKILVAAVAIAYSFAWLMWAARVSKAAGIAPFVYAGTSAVILVPMLWEETLHFHAFASSVTACVLAAFVGWLLHLYGVGNLLRCCGCPTALRLQQQLRFQWLRMRCCRSQSCCC